MRTISEQLTIGLDTSNHLHVAFLVAFSTRKPNLISGTSIGLLVTDIKEKIDEEEIFILNSLHFKMIDN